MAQNLVKSHKPPVLNYFVAEKVDRSNIIATEIMDEGAPIGSTEVVHKMVHSAQEYTDLVCRYLKIKRLQWNFKIPKPVIFVKHVRKVNDTLVEVGFDDVSDPPTAHSHTLVDMLWLPKGAFRKTEKGRMARGDSRRRRKQRKRDEGRAVLEDNVEGTAVLEDKVALTGRNIQDKQEGHCFKKANGRQTPPYYSGLRL